ncbi:MAG: hypothetical protein QNJ65_17575 [Xenococcaceae cyanobacterium MO_234.B1]|nr:hypothetical protein [Xenococcaceae cyanobacterium MO_234.B1]
MISNLDAIIELAEIRAYYYSHLSLHRRAFFFSDFRRTDFSKRSELAAIAERLAEGEIASLAH